MVLAEMAEELLEWNVEALDIVNVVSAKFWFVNVFNFRLSCLHRRVNEMLITQQCGSSQAGSLEQASGESATITLDMH